MSMRRFFMGPLYEEKDKGAGAEGGGGGGGDAAKPATGAQGVQGAADAAKGVQGAADAAKGVQGGNAGQGGARGGQPAAKQKPADTDDDDDDDDEGLRPGDDGLLKPMSLKAFTRRVGRASKKRLRELFGTSDEEAIATQWKEIPALRKYKDEAEKEKLTEREKLQREAADYKREAEEAKEKATAAEGRADAREVTSKLKTFLGDIVDRADVGDMMDKLARVVVKGDVKSFKGARAWVKEFVEAHPKWKKASGEDAKDEASGKDAKGKDEAGKGKEADSRRRIPVSTANRDRERPKPGGGSGAASDDLSGKSRAEILAETGWKI